MYVEGAAQARREKNATVAKGTKLLNILARLVTIDLQMPHDH
jgi:hypothetical protein